MGDSSFHKLCLNCINDAEEQSTEEIQENQEWVTAPSTNYVLLHLVGQVGPQHA